MMNLLWGMVLLLASISPSRLKAQTPYAEYDWVFSTSDPYSSSTEAIDNYTERVPQFLIPDDYVTSYEFPKEIVQNATDPNCINMCLKNNVTYFCENKTDPEVLRYLVSCVTPFCEPEVFQHNYVIRQNEGSLHITRWKRTRVGQNGTLQYLCLLDNGLPVTRECLLGKDGAQWAPTDDWDPVVCVGLVKEHTITIELNRLNEDMLGGRINLKDTLELRNVGQRMSTIFQKEKTILPADVQLVAEIFGALMEQPKDAFVSADLVSVCQEIMSSDSPVLRLSAELNATNSLLSNFESYLDAIPDQIVPAERCGKVVSNRSKTTNSGVESIDYSDIGVQALTTGNLSVFFANPECDAITGIAIFSAQAEGRLSSSSGFWYRFLRSTDDLNKIKGETHLETAAFLPENLWRVVNAKGVTYLIFKVYAHDALFVETSQNRSRRPRSKVISISIPELEDKTLPLPLPFVLRNENLRDPDVRSIDLGTGCGFWNYETWSSEGVTTGFSSDLLRDPIIECQTHHLTQFTFLIGGHYPTTKFGMKLISPLPERILDIISIVGCCLSLLGALGIFLTAAFFKKLWNKGPKKVLLHLCLPMCIQLVLFLFHNMNDTVEQMAVAGDLRSCVVLGAFMQYIILVLFSWMLIIAFVQFQLFVTVIGIDWSSHNIRKAAIVAWSLPLIPTLAVAFSDPFSYVPSAAQLSSGTAFCYPSGSGLELGVILPVALITAANLCILISIILNISKSRGFKSEQAKLATEVRASILMFFLLGLTWIFGILAFTHAGIVFSYLFCITATVQGFVMFVFFVLLDKASRQAWRGLLFPVKKKINLSRTVGESYP